MVNDNGTGELDFDNFVTGYTTLRRGAKTVHMEKDDSTLDDYQTLARKSLQKGAHPLGRSCQGVQKSKIFCDAK